MPLFTTSPLIPYVRTPLDTSSRGFRLVRLLTPKPPCLPGLSSTVRIEILEADLDSNLAPYDALSYTWGVPAGYGLPDREIIVETDAGSRELKVYRPLELALLHLAANRDIRRPLFVDQISIDQDDDEEKSRQVQLMRDIYTRCARTVVWLGPATRCSTRYFDYVREICDEGVMSRVMGPRLASYMRVFDAVMDPSLEVTDEQREDRDDILDMLRRLGPRFPLDGLADVLDRRWFRRLWIVQEACLAPVVVFVCGAQSLCFDCFRAGNLFYYMYNTQWIRLASVTSKKDLRRRNAIFDKTVGLTRIFQERKAIHQTGTRQDLYGLMLRYNINNGQPKSEASLAQDHVYGLLGLVSDDDALLRRVRVSYEADAARILTEVAALLLEESVDVLLFAQFPKLTPALPSWVPDWAISLRVPAGYSSLRGPVFAAGGTKAGARFCVDDATGLLTIRGVLVSRVVRVGERTLRSAPGPQIMDQIDYRWARLFFDEAAGFVRDAAGAAPDRPPDRETHLRLCDSGLSRRFFADKLGPAAGLERLGALHDLLSSLGQRLLNSDATVASYGITRIYRTVGITPWYWTPASQMASLRLCARDPLAASRLVYDALLDFVTDMAGMFLASARMAWATLYVRLRRRFGRVTLRPAPGDAARIGLDPDVAFGPDMAAYTDNLLKNAGRRLFRTADGHVGVGPGRMQPGDAVVVLHGGTVPHLVRGGDDVPWEYLGEAYCDGIMDGEALEGAEEMSFILA